MFGPFRLDLRTGELHRKTRRIILQPQPLQLLKLLLDRAGQLVTANEIHAALWGDESFGDFEHRAGMALKKLRDSLGDDPANPYYIETLRRRGYRFIAPVTFDVPGEIGGEAVSRPFVGREEPFAQLSASLDHVMRQQRQIVFVTGEIGIGKTALVDEFLTRAAADVESLRIRGQCVEGFGGKEAYYPMLQALEQLCQMPGEESVVETLASVAPSGLAQLPAFFTRQQHEKLLREASGAARDRMLREIVAALQSISTVDPVILVFEDLQWADKATIDLISALARDRAPAKLMLIGVLRPLDDAHPLKSVKHDLLIRKLCRQIELAGLNDEDIASYLALSAPAAPPPESLAEAIAHRSEGNPLFVISFLEHLQERGLLSLGAGRWEMNGPLGEMDLEFPEHLREMIELQMAVLPDQERMVLDLAAVEGLSFHTGTIAAAGELDAEAVEAACESLSRRRQLIRRASGDQGSDYAFIHALYREVIVQRQPPERHAALLRRITAAHALEAASAT
jgi:predicted ATPase